MSEEILDVNIEETILKELNDETRSVIDRYTEIYRKLLSVENMMNYSVFQKIIEVSDGISPADSDSVDKNPLVRDIGNQYYLLLKGLVQSISRLNPVPEEFYEKLYKSIFQSDVFPQKDAERGVILYLLSESITGLPYYRANDPVKLENDAFNEIVKELKDELKKALYILNDRFDSRAEEASQLCDIADSIEEREKKSVFWACVINAKRKSEEQQAD